MKNREIIKKKQIFIIKHNNNIKYIKINMANNLLFKGIQQVKALPANPVNGVIYFVREFIDGNPTGNAKIYFGSRLYGEVPTTRLAELQIAIEANQTDITSIKQKIGEWNADVKTIATAVIEVSGTTQTNASEIKNLKKLVGENNVSESINEAKTEAINTSTGYTQTQINGLNGNVTGDSEHITVNVVEENGKITEVIVSEENIASKDEFTDHTGDTTAHITAQERTDWNSAKERIDTFLKDADMTEKAVDTLAELQSYMTSDGEAAAQVVERIAALEAIDHDAYVDADETVLANAKSYADGAAATAEQNAKNYADGIKTNLVGDAGTDYNTLGKLEDKIQEVAQSLTEKNVDAEGDAYVTATASKNKVTVAASESTKNSLALADSALQNSDITTGDANGTISVKGVDVAVKGLGSAAYTNSNAYDAAGAATTAETNAKKYTDGLLGGGFSTTDTVSSVIADINTRLTSITNDAVTSVASSGKTITVTENEGAVNVEVNTLEHAESGQDGYVILQKNSSGQLYGVMYYGGDDVE